MDRLFTYETSKMLEKLEMIEPEMCEDSYRNENYSMESVVLEIQSENAKAYIKEIFCYMKQNWVEGECTVLGIMKELYRIAVTGEYSYLQAYDEIKIPKDIVRREQYISIIDADLAYYKRTKSVMTDASRKEFGSNLIDAINTSRHSEKFKPIAFKYQGFRVIVPSLKKDEAPYVKLQGVNGGNYKVKMDTDKPLGCCQILNHYLGTQLKMIRDRHEKQCTEGRINMRHAQEEIKKGNNYVKQIEALRMEIEKMEKELELSA